MPSGAAAPKPSTIVARRSPTASGASARQGLILNRATDPGVAAANTRHQSTATHSDKDKTASQCAAGGPWAVRS